MAEEQSKGAPNWLRRRGRKAARMVGLKEGGVFDKIKYWHWMEWQGEKYFEAPSRVKELLPIRGRRCVVVVCFNGEVIALDNAKADLGPKTEWQCRVVPPLPADENKPTELRHAAYDSLQGVIYFTVGFSAVFYASLNEMEMPGSPNRVVRLKPLIGEKEPQQIHGLAVDPEHSLLFVCNSSSVSAWSTSKLDEPRQLQEISFTTPVTPSISPYKVAVYLDIRGSTKILLAVCDKENSTLTQLQLKYSKTSLGFGKAKAIDYNVISTLSSKGSGFGALQKPQGIHFDLGGNLFVCDDKNNRLQVYPFAADGTTALDCTNSASDTLYYPASVIGSLKLLKTVAIVTKADDSPVILAGFSGPFSNVGAKKIMKFTYRKDTGYTKDHGQ